MRLYLKTVVALLMSVAAANGAKAQESFEKTYEYRINYQEGEVTITGVRPGVKLKGDVQIPGSYTSTKTGERYTVVSLRGDQIEPEYGKMRPVFENQDEMTSVYIPSTINDIVAGAFRGCKRLKEFKVSSQNKEFKAVDGLLYHLRGEAVDLMRFPPAKTSTGFTLPDECWYILAGAFADNYTITTLRLSKWQLLMNDVFEGNLGITKIELIDSYMYETNATGDYLVSKEDPGLLVAVAPRYKMGGLLSIPSSIHTIGWGALTGSRATSVSIPSTVKSIHGYAFAGTSLQKVTIPATVTDLMTDGLFYNCPELVSVDIKPSIAEIGKFMFMGCGKLESVTLPNSCKSLKAYAFVGCESLKEFTGLYRFPNISTEGGCQFAESGMTSANIPTAWQTLPDGIFRNCADMTSVSLNDGVETVGDRAFEGTSLETINTRNVNYVGYWGFTTLSTLRKVVIPAHEGTMTLASSAFQLAPSAEIYIDHKSMAGLTSGWGWHWSFDYPQDALPKIYTSKRSFSQFFTEFDELYVPAGSRVHYKSLCGAGSECRDRIYEMFSYSGVNPSKRCLTITPSYYWVKITSVTIDGKEATADGELWSVAGAGSSSSSTMNVVINYTVKDIKMSTEYNLSASSGVEETVGEMSADSRRPKVVRHTGDAPREGAVYYDMSGRVVANPVEGGLYIVR